MQVKKLRNTKAELISNLAVSGTVQLCRRLYGRVSLLFLFNLGGEFSQLPEAVSWLRELEKHSTFVAAAYGPAFADVGNDVHACDSSIGCKQRTLKQPATAPSARKWLSVNFLCIEETPFWLRSLAVRSVGHSRISFFPTAAFREFDLKWRCATQSHELKRKDSRVALRADFVQLAQRIGGSHPQVVGCLFGYAGKWKTPEADAFHRKPSSKFVTTLLVDELARVRWHATGKPTDEAVRLLL